MIKGILTYEQIISYSVQSVISSPILCTTYQASVHHLPSICKRYLFQVDRGGTVINPLKPNVRLLYLKTQSVPRCKHFSSRL